MIEVRSRNLILKIPWLFNCTQLMFAGRVISTLGVVVQLAVRSSLTSPLTAGVALVGATAIALSPLAPPVPDLKIKAEQVTSVFADYTPTSLASAIADLVASGGLAAAQGLHGIGVGASQALAGIGAIGSTALGTVGAVGNTLGATAAGR
jgi:hypothetical protein